MRIAFVSNYYNHHQSALSKALYDLTDGQYLFVQTEEMESERTKMGWGGVQQPSFVKWAYESKTVQKECLEFIWQADVVIAGGSPAVEKYIQRRIKAGKLLFRYSERVYKNDRAMKQRLLRGVKYHLCNFPYKNLYLLSASAYAAADYAKTGNFVNKAYKWGYFPAVKKYENVDALLAEKESATILWTARFIDWKHPEACLQIAKRLKEEGYAFRLCMIGNGILEETVRMQIQQEGLEEYVFLLGSMKPEQVRLHMEKAGIFLFTSDFNEGWGAVLNESMNSGCAVVASHAIGAAPYLVENGRNGLLYQDGNQEELYHKIKYLLDHPDQQRVMGRSAYYTIQGTWNAEVAAERLVAVAQRLLQGERMPLLFADGPCSEAEVIKNHWYHCAETEWI